MSAIVKTGLLVAVVTFATLGIFVAAGVWKPDIEDVFIRVASVLGILFVASLAIAFIAKPSGERAGD